VTRKGPKAADEQAELPDPASIDPAPVDPARAPQDVEKVAEPAEPAEPAEQAAETVVVDARKAATDARKAAADARKAAANRARQRVAVIIPAKDESRRIAATVRSARAIPHVDLVLVVDDGSEDDTQHVAREAGAVVVRHSHNRGKAAAMETGAAVVAMRDTPDRQPRILLFIDGDLGETAVNTAPLVPPVFEGHADLAIALLPPQPGAGGRGIVVGAARRAIASMTGWTPTQPLSGMRCLTRAAFEAATPLARGWGVETGMTIDLLRAGFRVIEVPCELRHRPSGSDLRGQMHRAAQYRDVQLAVSSRRVRRAAGAVKRTVTPSPAQRPPQTHR
jgi:glycosyl transferase family 2